MSAYPPPSENLPIFDSGLFGNNSDLTIDNLKTKFLQFPYAQSGLETIPNLAISSSGTAPTPVSTSNDTSIATTAFVKSNALTPLSPNPAGTYTTPSSVVVNSYGQVTSATAGTTYTLPSPAPTSGDYTAPSAVSVNSAGQITSITAGTAYSLPSPAPTSGDYTAPSAVSVNSAGQITSITAGTAYSLPSPAPTAGTYTNATISVNSAGQITSASNGTGNTYNPIYQDGAVASPNPYTFRWSFSNSALTASAYQVYIYQVGGTQTLPYGDQAQYTSIATPTIIGGQTASSLVTRENISFIYGGTTYNAWGYSFGTTSAYPEVNVSYYSTINVQNGYDWYINIFMRFNNAFTPAGGLNQRIMLVPVI